MARPPGIFKNDQAARACFGDAYDAIPKSVFATIAWHLANLAGGELDVQGNAEKRFLEEWNALIPHGLSAPSGQAKAALKR